MGIKFQEWILSPLVSQVDIYEIHFCKFQKLLWDQVQFGQHRSGCYSTCFQEWETDSCSGWKCWFLVVHRWVSRNYLRQEEKTKQNPASSKSMSFIWSDSIKWMQDHRGLHPLLDMEKLWKAMTAPELLIGSADSSVATSLEFRFSLCSIFLC